MSEKTLVCPTCGLETSASPGALCTDDGALLVIAESQKAYPRDRYLGRVIGEKYAIVGVLGMGGFGAVYRALQQPVERQVAIKLIRPEVADREGLRVRFFREAKVVARLNHPAAVTLFDYGETPAGELYMVFELVDGVPLSAVIRQGCVEPRRAVKIARSVLEALAVAHEMGTGHRDLKPDNIMVTAGRMGREHVKVLDFGIAKLLGSEQEESMTQTGIVLGTPHYMAPEQATGQDIDGRCDLYALGVILYEMLVGAVPFNGNTPFQVLVAHQHQDVPAPPPTLELPVPLISLVFRALKKQPEERFASAEEMGRALTVFLEGPITETTALPHMHTAPVTRTSAEFASEVVAPTSPKRPWTIAIALAMVAAILGIGLWALRSNPPEPDPVVTHTPSKPTVTEPKKTPPPPPPTLTPKPVAPADVLDVVRSHIKAGQDKQALAAFKAALQKSSDPKQLHRRARGDARMVLLVDNPDVLALIGEKTPPKVMEETPKAKPKRKRKRKRKPKPKPDTQTAKPKTKSTFKLKEF